MPDDRRSIWSWAMYDWANSAFATTVMAGFFPLFFKGYWANPDNPTQSTFTLGLANAAASVIVAAMAPFLGAVADRGSAKKRFLFLFTFLGCVMTGALWLISRGDWPLAVGFYVATNVGFSGGMSFYDSLLPGIASEKRVDYASSLGYALGYIGGGLLFLLNVLMYLYGFYNMLGKFAAVVGPAVMGSVTLLTGNIRYGIISILILFIAGGCLLTRVDIAEGERIAREDLM